MGHRLVAGESLISKVLTASVSISPSRSQEGLGQDRAENHLSV